MISIGLLDIPGEHNLTNHFCETFFVARITFEFFVSNTSVDHFILKALEVSIFYRRQTNNCVKHLWDQVWLELVQHCIFNHFCCHHFVWISLDSPTHSRGNQRVCCLHCLSASVHFQDAFLASNHHHSSQLFTHCLCCSGIHQHPHFCFGTRSVGRRTTFALPSFPNFPGLFFPLYKAEQQKWFKTSFLAHPDWKPDFADGDGCYFCPLRCRPLQPLVFRQRQQQQTTHSRAIDDQFSLPCYCSIHTCNNSSWCQFCY